MLIHLSNCSGMRALGRKKAAAIRPAYELIIPKIEMLVGAWHVDEYGNRAREIKARD